PPSTLSLPLPDALPISPGALGLQACHLVGRAGGQAEAAPHALDRRLQGEPEGLGIPQLERPAHPCLTTRRRGRWRGKIFPASARSEEHTSELQSRENLV